MFKRLAAKVRQRRTTQPVQGRPAPTHRITEEPPGESGRAAVGLGRKRAGKSWGGGVAGGLKVSGKGFFKRAGGTPSSNASPRAFQAVSRARDRKAGLIGPGGIRPTQPAGSSLARKAILERNAGKAAPPPGRRVGPRRNARRGASVRRK